MRTTATYVGVARCASGGRSIRWSPAASAGNGQLATELAGISSQPTVVDNVTFDDKRSMVAKNILWLLTVRPCVCPEGNSGHVLQFVFLGHTGGVARWGAHSCALSPMAAQDCGLDAVPAKGA